MMDFAAEQHVGEYHAKGMLFRGWAKASLGDVAGGLDDMRSALESEEEAGIPSDFPIYYEMFAEVCERAGRFEEGLDAVTKGFAQAERGRLVYWNAELHRRRGELMFASGGNRPAVADCFEQALAAARAQGALLLELRAAASIARLGRDEDRDPVAYLRTAYAGFPSGLDTPDLRDARTLLAVTP
jgi:predicted ATPase